MISRITEAKQIPNAEDGFALTFSDQPFDGYDAVLEWLRCEEAGIPASGNWYSGIVAGQVMECWLCPALFLYFNSAPAHLFVRADPLPEGVDPIWHDFDGEGRRFMGPDSE